MVSDAASSGLLLMAPFGKASSKSWLEATLGLDSRLLMLINHIDAIISLELAPISM